MIGLFFKIFQPYHSLTHLLGHTHIHPINPIKMHVYHQCLEMASCLNTKCNILMQPRTFAGVGVLGGQLYAAGGHDGPLVRKSVEVYDPSSNTWRPVCDMNMCRRNAG